MDVVVDGIVEVFLESVLNDVGWCIGRSLSRVVDILVENISVGYVFIALESLKLWGSNVKPQLEEGMHRQAV